MPETGPWQVTLLREPKKVLAKVPADLRRRLLDALHRLEADPRPTGCKKLQGHDDLYRQRVGDWRIVYAVRSAQGIILVTEIAPRGSAYRKL